jgi:hypothetical protein
MDIHHIKMGSEILESRTRKSQDISRPSLVLINECFQDLRKLPSIIAAKQSPGA